MTAASDISLPSRPHSAYGWSIALAILLILAGFLAIFMPIASGLTVTLIVGWLFLFAGIIHFLLAWKTHTTKGVLWEILLAILYIFSAGYLILHPLAGLATLTLLLAIYFLIKGVMQFIHYFQLRPRHGAGWLILDGIVSLILGFMVWREWPFSSVWVIGTLVGIGLLFTGITRLMVTLTARRMQTI